MGLSRSLLAIARYTGPPPTSLRSFCARQLSSFAQNPTTWRVEGATPSTRKPETRDLPREPEYTQPVAIQNGVPLEINGYAHHFTPIFLRDLCRCPRCIDLSTRQKLYSTTDIPHNILAEQYSVSPRSVTVKWTNDVPGYGPDHTTELPLDLLSRFVTTGTTSLPFETPQRSLWTAQAYRQETHDFDYESYMNDDAALLKALNQLHSHGLLFVTGVPKDERSVQGLAERIGPLKTTFYGPTWDVRSVPQAINVAYTSQNLGFHMDLMYMKQPPHLQLLHCIRSSSNGGASLFSDSFRTVQHLAENDMNSFNALSRVTTDFHYDHPGSEYYHQSRPVIEQQVRQASGENFHDWADYRARGQGLGGSLTLFDFVEAVAWAPPFQASFALRSFPCSDQPQDSSHLISRKIISWHNAAKKFDALIHEPENIYERLMQPGECVIFDNRRVLHARRTFDVGDVGKERWLRGAYIDKDPYMSRMKVLSARQQH